MGQRISRAKKTLAEARAEFELPVGRERTERLDDVMAVIYLIFNEGYSATAGEDWMRPDLANEAMRLARMLADAGARRARGARAAGAAGDPGLADAPPGIDDDGDPVLLEAQDRTRVGPAADPSRAGRAPAGRAARRARQARRDVLPAGLDRRAARPRETRRGHRLAPDRDPVRRAGPGRAGTDRRGEPRRRARAGVRPGCRARRARTSWTPRRLGDSPLVPSVRGDLLERAGLYDQAAAAFTEAASRTRNESERGVLQRRAERCRTRASQPG